MRWRGSRVGDAQVFGGGDYAMRARLDPDKIVLQFWTASDVVSAMREQNVQVSAGQLGAEPMPNSQFLTLINACGRLRSEQEFGDIVLKNGDNGEVVRLADVAALSSAPAITPCAPSSMARMRSVSVSSSRRAPMRSRSAMRSSVMNQMQKTFPSDVKYEAVYDTTIFVRDLISAVVDTLLEAVLLVVLVVILFLQTGACLDHSADRRQCRWWGPLLPLYVLGFPSTP